MHPAIVGRHTVRSVGDVSGVHSQAVIELSLEKLWKGEGGAKLGARGEGGPIRGGKGPPGIGPHNLPLAPPTQVGSVSFTWLHQDHVSPQASEHRCGGVGTNRLCWGLLVTPQSGHPLTCTPRMPKMIKKAQQMSTMLPMGLREEMSVSTTSFKPGARLMTLQADKERRDTVSQQRDIPNSAHSHQAS